MKSSLIPIGVPILALCLCAQTIKTASVSGASWLTALSTSPDGQSVAAFAMNGNGEAVLGSPLRITSANKLMILSERHSVNPEAIGWRSSTQLILGLDDGVFEWASDGRLRSLWKGLNAGLAVSVAGDRVAFWSLGDRASHDYFDLVIVDVATKSVIRRWKVKVVFDKDLNSFDIVFSGDSNVIYARTFEAEEDRPLEAFDITTGSITRIVDKSSGLASTADGVYFVRQESVAYALQRIVGKDGYRSVDSSFPSARIAGNRSGHQLITPRPVGNAIWVYNTSDNTKRSLPTKCDNAAPFADGSLLFAKAAQLFWGSCGVD